MPTWHAAHGRGFIRQHFQPLQKRLQQLIIPATMQGMAPEHPCGRTTDTVLLNQSDNEHQIHISARRATKPALELKCVLL